MVVMTVMVFIMVIAVRVVIVVAMAVTVVRAVILPMVVMVAVVVKVLNGGHGSQRWSKVVRLAMAAIMVFVTIRNSRFLGLILKVEYCWIVGSNGEILNAKHILVELRRF